MEIAWLGGDLARLVKVLVSTQKTFKKEIEASRKARPKEK